LRERIRQEGKAARRTIADEQDGRHPRRVDARREAVKAIQ
jgi:hypothetical protein